MPAKQEGGCQFCLRSKCLALLRGKVRWYWWKSRHCSLKTAKRVSFEPLLLGCIPNNSSSSEADVEGVLQPLVTGIVCLGHSEGWWVWGQAGIRRLIIIR